MSVLLITYDYANTDPKLDRIPSLMRDYKHIRLAEGSYAIETYEKTRTVFNKIFPFLSANVHLLVVTLIKPFSGPVHGPASEWLAKHLPEA